MDFRSSIVAVASIMILHACARQPAKPVENLGGGQDVSRFTLTSLKGTRNGDRLDVKAVYSEGSGLITVGLHFRVTPPTRLESGTWNGLGNEGSVHERSSTFLGGQSGPPSIGGRFDLLAPDGQPLYRVTIPLQPLAAPESYPAPFSRAESSFRVPDHPDTLPDSGPPHFGIVWVRSWSLPHLTNQT